MHYLEGILDNLDRSLSVPNRALLILLAGVSVLIVSGVFLSRHKPDGENRLPEHPNHLLIVVSIAGAIYIIWTLTGFASGSHLLTRYDLSTFRHRLFSEPFAFKSYGEAREILGNRRYSAMLQNGYSLAEMSTVFKGAPADHRRIEIAERQLRGNIYDLSGNALIENRIDSTTGSLTRYYAPHPGLRRLLGRFDVSPEQKQGLEWAYRDVVAPEVVDSKQLFNFGSDLRLSLHAGAQKRAFEALHLDGFQRKGTVVVLNPHTGEVYVLVSSPGTPPPHFPDPLVEHLTSRLDSLKASFLTGETAADFSSFKAELQKVEQRFRETDRSTVYHLVDRLDSCALSTTRMDKDPSGKPDVHFDDCLPSFDSLHTYLTAVHLYNMSRSFYAHERMHFRQSAFSLGSAFKPFIASVAEDAGLGSTFTCSLSKARAMGVPRRILAFEAERLPSSDRSRAFSIEEGLYRSLNTVFAPLAWQLQETLGTDTLIARLESLGFNHPIPWNSASEGLNTFFPIYSSDLFGERLDPQNAGYYRANIYSLGIGAENMLRATPLHVALMAAYLANGSYVPMPTLETNRPIQVLSHPGLDPAALHRIRGYMHKAVTNRRGTSYRLYQDSLRSLYVAAKTGTSTRDLSPFEIHFYDLLDRSDISDLTGYHAWSVAMAGPSEDDLRIVAVVSIHDAMRSGYRPGLQESEWASRTAVRVMYEVLTYLQHEGFFL